MSNEEELNAIMRNFRLGMMQLSEMFAPVEEAARGMREDLVKKGWSPESADTMACEYYVSVMRQIRENASS